MLEKDVAYRMTAPLQEEFELVSASAEEVQEKPPRKKLALWQKIAIGAVALAVIIALLSWLSTLITPDELQAWLRGWGVWTPLVYIVLVIVTPIFFVPLAPLAMMSGLLFGLWRGFAYTMVGAIINCNIMYLMTQRLGKARVQAFLSSRLSPAWLARIESLEGRTGVIFLFILRVTALIPYNVINYAFGLTNMKYRDYMLASIAGIIPPMLIYANMGDKALDITSPDFWMAFAMLALLLVLSAVLLWWFFPRSKSAGDVKFTPLPGEPGGAKLPDVTDLNAEELEWTLSGAGTWRPPSVAGVREALAETRVGVRSQRTRGFVVDVPDDYDVDDEPTES